MGGVMQLDRAREIVEASLGLGDDAELLPTAALRQALATLLVGQERRISELEAKMSQDVSA